MEARVLRTLLLAALASSPLVQAQLVGGGGTVTTTDVLGRPATLNDLDRDGWDDLWTHFFKDLTHRDKDRDTDRDGLTDYQEMILRLSPYQRNPWPSPRGGGGGPQEAGGPPNNMFALTFPTEVGRPYLAQTSTDLQNWTTFENWFLAPTTEFVLTDNNAVEEKKFYRLNNSIRAGFTSFPLDGDDDNSSEDLEPFGFSVNFFGTPFAECRVNNNGNITFGNPLAQFTPQPLVQFDQPMIAAFWGDVDTTPAGSANVSFGPGTVSGYKAFGVNYVDVGYFETHVDKLNRFQLVLIDRSDVSGGDFDVEFNYDQLLWETGDESFGTNGYGGASARVGVCDGTGLFLEHNESGVDGHLLDFLNPETNPQMNQIWGLVFHSHNNPLPGRYLIPFRNGVPVTIDAGPPQTITGRLTVPGSNATTMAGSASFASASPFTVKWTRKSGPGTCRSSTTRLWVPA